MISASRACLSVAFALMSLSSGAEARDTCKGGISYTYPDGKHTWATYFVDDHQRDGDCFKAFCPADCTFKTSPKPTRLKSSQKANPPASAASAP